MFLLVSGRHVGAHTDGHQHGVSLQISRNLGKKFLHVSRIRKITVTRILARVFVYLPSFISQILDFIYWPALIFILIYFELRDTENQQFAGYWSPGFTARFRARGYAARTCAPTEPARRLLRGSLRLSFGSLMWRKSRRENNQEKPQGPGYWLFCVLYVIVRLSST